MTMEPVARFEDVTFRYGRRVALPGLDLTINAGITGLLGPNGAGKSTLLSLLATRRAAGSGRMTVLGEDAGTVRGRTAIRSRIGFLAQRYPLVGSMRVVDTIAYAAWAQGVARSQAYLAADDAIARFDLGNLCARRVRGLSGGQRQRVGLAASMAHKPDLVILDEPSAGLDPEVRMAIRRTLREVAVTSSILLSTHLVDDVLAICDSIVVLDGGRVLFQGEPATLSRSVEDAQSDSPGSPLEQGYEAILMAGRARAAR